ncbi:hypothetical protein F4821DRAFT_277634 [Hypoxylon rubiginosum]|uniref:Uncharacterized protein n=1 Tax=Hypoxylon rubiginosum TaxID=110542 RepID=A0ACC0D5T1_9PEZI|nr:hypothetical protein F4821DRAFT_277634 [Hypoxylon rubiginosum]
MSTTTPLSFQSHPLMALRSTEAFAGATPMAVKSKSEECRTITFYHTCGCKQRQNPVNLCSKKDCDHSITTLLVGGLPFACRSQHGPSEACQVIDPATKSFVREADTANQLSHFLTLPGCSRERIGKILPPYLDCGSQTSFKETNDLNKGTLLDNVPTRTGSAVQGKVSLKELIFARGLKTPIKEFKPAKKTESTTTESEPVNEPERTTKPEIAKQPENIKKLESVAGSEPTNKPKQPIKPEFQEAELVKESPLVEKPVLVKVYKPAKTRKLAGPKLILELESIEKPGYGIEIIEHTGTKETSSSSNDNHATSQESDAENSDISGTTDSTSAQEADDEEFNDFVGADPSSPAVEAPAKARPESQIGNIFEDAVREGAKTPLSSVFSNPHDEIEADISDMDRKNLSEREAEMLRQMEGMNLALMRDSSSPLHVIQARVALQVPKPTYMSSRDRAPARSATPLLGEGLVNALGPGDNVDSDEILRYNQVMADWDDEKAEYAELDAYMAIRQHQFDDPKPKGKGVMGRFMSYFRGQ